MSDEQRSKEDVTRRAKADLEEGKQQAREAMEEARARAGERLEEGSREAARGVEDIAEAVSSAASRLDESEHEGLADYASQLASWLGDVSERLREKSVDELAGDVRELARRNPALFVLGSVALGVGLSRFLKASRQGRPAGDGQWDPLAADEEAWRQRQSAEWSASPAVRPGTAPDRQMTPDTGGGGGL